MVLFPVDYQSPTRKRAGNLPDSLARRASIRAKYGPIYISLTAESLKTRLDRGARPRRLAMARNFCQTNLHEKESMYGVLHPVGGGDPIPLLKKSLMVGRRESCDIVLRFSNVSSQHCELNINDGFWYVRDLNSRNGVKVNGNRVTEKRIDPGDVLAIAKHAYEVNYSPVDLARSGRHRQIRRMRSFSARACWNVPACKVPVRPSRSQCRSAATAMRRRRDTTSPATSPARPDRIASAMIRCRSRLPSGTVAAGNREIVAS